jgi:hypothetical protein
MSSDEAAWIIRGGRTLKSVLIKLAISAAVVLLWNFAYGRIMQWKSQRGGFRDWLRNPAYKKTSQDYFAERAALTVPDNISDSEIRTLVERVFVQKDEDSTQTPANTGFCPSAG